MDRRNFLISSAAALSASSSVFGAASDTVRVAVVGIGGRARDHIAGLLREPNVEIAAICDPDDSHLDRGQKQIAAGNQKAPGVFATYASCWKTSPSTPSPSPGLIV